MIRRGISVALVALAVSAGCACHTGDASPRAMANPEPLRPFVGVWEGDVWETPSSLYQGERRVTLIVEPSGAWTSSSDNRATGAGVVVVCGGRVYFERRTAAFDTPLPYSFKERNGRLWAVYDTSFGGRGAPAAIQLERTPGSTPR